MRRDISRPVKAYVCHHVPWRRIDRFENGSVIADAGESYGMKMKTSINNRMNGMFTTSCGVVVNYSRANTVLIILNCFRSSSCLGWMCLLRTKAMEPLRHCVGHDAAFVPASHSRAGRNGASGRWVRGGNGHQPMRRRAVDSAKSSRVTARASSLPST